MAQNQDSLLERLVPIAVPWQIALATPYLRLEINDYGSRTLSFIASFLLDATAKEERLVTVTFKKLKRVRVNYITLEGGGMDENLYDWTDVPLRFTEEMNLSVREKQYNAMWLNSGVCPDPRMYQVIQSQLLEPNEIEQHQVQHYLAVGEEFTLDIVAGDWKWSAGEPIDWSQEKTQ